MRSFGAPDAPSMFDLDALQALSDKFEVQKRLSLAWQTQLTIEEQTSLESHFGCTLDSGKRIVQYALELTGQILAFGLLVATRFQFDAPSGGGQRTYLYNEATKIRLTLPVIDRKDMEWVVIVEGWGLRTYQFVQR